MTAPSATINPHDHLADGLVTCQNCGHVYAGRYCSQCSQRADTHRINWHYIGHEIPHSVWHVDRGILFTLRELLTRPGPTIREFLEGRRVNHYRPLALLLILGAIVAFASHSLNVSFAQKSQELFNPSAADASARVKIFQEEVIRFIEKQQTLLHIITIPLYALWFWVLFRRRGYNYPEMLVTQTFIANFGLVLSLAIVMLFWLLGGSASAFSFVMGLTLVVMMGYNAGVYSHLFKGKLRPRTIVIRTLVAYLLGYASLSVVGGSVGAAYVLLNRHKFDRKGQPTESSITTQKPH